MKKEQIPSWTLTCDTVMVAAADEVDVCALFEDEVDRALEAGWGGASVYNEFCGRPEPFVAWTLPTPTADVPGTGGTQLGSRVRERDRGSSPPSGTTMTAESDRQRTRSI